MLYFVFINILQVTVEDHEITIYLRTGLLTVEGRLAHEWFKIIFRKIMASYDKLTAANPVDYFKDQIILDTRKELQQKQSINYLLNISFKHIGLK